MKYHISTQLVPSPILMPTTPPLEKMASTIAAFGVPGLIYTCAVAATGLYGAAAITTALAALGPGGIAGGIAFLGIAGLVTQGIAKYGSELLLKAVIMELYNRGETKESLRRKIGEYWISHELKLKLYYMLSHLA